MTATASNQNTRSCFVFSLPKAGSSLVNALIREIADETGMIFRSVMDEYFAQGMADREIPLGIGKSFEEYGYVYGGFRYLPFRLEIPILDNCKSIFLVRDPRDILVSWYFSVAYSHVIPGAANASGSTKFTAEFLAARKSALTLDINEWVLRQANGLADLAFSYRFILKNPLVKIYRYEDVIFNIEAWVSDICSHFGWPVSKSMCVEIARRHDLLATTVEDPKNHVRQIKPGDHKNKLSPDTVAILNKQLRPFLEAFRYSDATSYFPEAIELLRRSSETYFTCAMVRSASASEVNERSALPLLEANRGTQIDDGTVECLGYWIEGDEDTLRFNRPLRVCYLLHFLSDLSDIVLGASVYHVETREQFGRNTADFGPISARKGSCILVKWNVARLPGAGRYLASVGVSKSAAVEVFRFRQHRLREFKLSE